MASRLSSELIKTSEQRKEVTKMDKNMDEKISEETPQPVKVGDKEYSQDELSKLVGLGETARELETQWNRPIDKLYPDYTQKSQKLAEYERKEQERADAELKAKAEAGNLSPEETRKLALEEAKSLGIVTKDMLHEVIGQEMEKTFTAKAWVDGANEVLQEAQEKGQPKTTVDDLLKFSQTKGFGLQVAPKDVYKLMFEPQIDAWKEEQLGKIKQKGLDTQTGTQAGAKQPETPAPITSRDALSQAVAARLRQGAGQERG